MNKSVKMAQSIVGTSVGRSDKDFYPTPSHAVYSLLENEYFNPWIWECACGNGAISKVLFDEGYHTIDTDLYDYGYGKSGIDFLSTKDPTSGSYDIITNPPFNLAEQFVSHAIFDLSCERVALLLKLAFLEGQKRSKLLQTTPLEKVLVFKKRLTMTRNGEPQRSSGMIAFAWFIWNKNRSNLNPEIWWI